MSLRKIQTLKSTKGFTLVELIVVITILAVLAAIAFISIWNVTGDARNSKRQNDLSSISTAVRNIVEIKGMPITNAVSDTWTGTSMLQSGSIFVAWRPVVVITTWPDNKLEYKAWDIDYNKIQIKQTEFQDPNGIPYIIWTTKLAWQVFEIAATLEQPGNKKQAYVIGTYVPRTWTGTNPSNSLTWVVDTNHKKITIQDDKDVGKFKVWDVITGSWVNSEITSISSDGRTLTYDNVTYGSWSNNSVNGYFAPNGGTNFTPDATTNKLYFTLGFYDGSGSVWNSEPNWLIQWKDWVWVTCNKSPITSDSQICIPY